MNTDLLKLSELKSAIIREPLVVNLAATMAEAIALMTVGRSQCDSENHSDIHRQEFQQEMRSSCVFVVAEEKVIGVITERDVVRLSAQQQNLNLLLVKDVMCYPVVTLYESELTDLSLTVNILQQHHIRHLPILDHQDRLVGMVTHESLRQISRPIDLMRLRLVSEVMTTNVICAPPDASMLLIAQLMTEHHISSVMIVETLNTQEITGEFTNSSLQTPVGIVTERDIVQFQSLALNLKNCIASTVMSTPIFSVRPEDSLWTVQHIMEEKLIRRLAVTGRSGELLGIVTQISLLQALNPIEIYNLAKILKSQVEQLEAEKITLLKDRNTDLERQVAKQTASLQNELQEHEQAKKVLQRTEYLFQEAQRIAHIGNWELDLRSNSLYWSDEVFQIFEIEPHKFGGSYEDFLQSVHPDDRDIVHLKHTQSLNDGNPYTVVYRLLLEDGRIKYIQSKAEIVFGEDGVAILSRGTVQDITKLKLAQIQLQNANQSLEAKVAERTKDLLRVNKLQRAFLDSTDYAIITIDLQGLIQTFNIGAEKMLGYRADEVVGLASFTIFYDLQEITDRAASFSAELGKNIRVGLDVFTANITQGTAHEYEWTKIRKDGSRLSAIVTLTELRDEDDFLIGYLSISKDISDRKQAEAQLQQINNELLRATQLKDEFLANMSHELRTPLNAILGITEGLMDEVFGVLSQKQKTMLQTVERSGNHLLELINDILDLSKIEAGKLILDFTFSNIHQLCQSSIMFVKQQAMQKNIKLEIQIPKVMPDLEIDERRIRQVLINLLNNAVKFTPERGRINLIVTLESSISEHSDSTFTSQKWVRFAVTDTGIGIASEGIKTLFQPFIQIDSALNRKYEGTGLGLALVKRIVELHSGRVSVTSELGIGSSFTIELPYSETISQISHDLSDITPAASKAIVNSDEFPLILLAEDNEANIIMISTYLEAKGFQLVVARDGQQAIALVQSANPDLVLMNIQMPVLDGLEAIKWIRQNYSTTLPIIAITALAMTGDREKCLEAGASDYLSKPIKLNQLAIVIQQLSAAL